MAELDVESKPPPQQPVGFSRWVPSLPTTLVSSFNPFASEGSTTTSTERSNTDAPPKKQSILASIFPTSTPPTPSAPQATADPKDADNASDMFAEPDARSNSDASREGSVDEGGQRRGSKKHGNRPKTSFSICHPPPTSTARHRLHRRPRSLLQLHKISSNARPRPAFEVVPSANFSVRLTKAITKLYKARHSLCPSDLVVLKAEKYAPTYDEDDEQQVRDIVALICKGKKEDGCATGKSKICLPDGQEWEAYATTNGGYEFFTTNEHGLGVTARWVPKKNARGRDGDARKFNFSTISPNSRRHPVIATLSKTGLHINDTYKMPDPSNTTPLNTPRQASTILEDTMADEDGMASTDNLTQLYHTTDDHLRELITITSIWVLFKESWSPNFKYDDKDTPAFTPVVRSPSLRHSPTKSDAFLHSATPPASPGLESIEKRSSIKSISSSVFGNSGPGRRQSMMNRSNRASRASVNEEQTPAGFATTDDLIASRARAGSQSTVLVHRAASNRRKSTQQATWRPDLLAASSASASTPAGIATHQPQLAEIASEEDTRAPSNSTLSAKDSDAKLDEEEDEADDRDHDDEGESPHSPRRNPLPAAEQPNGTHRRKASRSSRAGLTVVVPAGAVNGSGKGKGGSAKGKTKGRSVLRKLFCGSGGRSDMS